VRNGDERVTRELLAGEALYILRNLKDNKTGGRSNKLADVKATLEPTVTLEFDNYFFFLRKYNFIAMDREACLQLTAEGEKVLEGSARERFGDAVGEYFASRLGDEPAPMSGGASQETQGRASRPIAPPPPPAPDAISPIRLSADQVIAEGSMPAGGPFEAPSPFDSTPAPLPPPPAPAAKPKKPTRAAQPEPEAAVAQPSRPAESPRSAEARPATSSSPGGELDGRYLKSDPFGAGPLGQVFRGKQVSTGVDVAVKELKDIFGYFSFLQRSEVMKRLKKELQAQAAVRHPSVCQVLDLNLDTARPYFVLELCAGGSLREEMEEAEGRGLKVEQAIRYFLQICYGLRAAHATGLTHTNLKPENILIDQMGNAKLADFGLTRVIEVDSVKGMPQVIVGTGGMGYLPPELLSRGKGVGASPSADVYSLGILFYEMLTGSLPGRRSPLPSGARKDVPERIDAIFDKMTQDRKDDRIPDIDSVLTEFYSAFPGNEYSRKGDLILWSDTPGAPAKVADAPAEAQA
jgi:hypothetical protein